MSAPDDALTRKDWTLGAVLLVVMALATLASLWRSDRRDMQRLRSALRVDSAAIAQIAAMRVACGRP